MRRKHHRHYQGRFTRLASLARSLTATAAAGLLLTFATLLVITPAQGNAQSATYTVTFQGNWTTASTPGGVVSGAHFTTLIGTIHNDMVIFWKSGETATSGVENVAELGLTGTFKSEINADSNAISVVEKSISGGGTGSATFDVTVTNEHPLVTLLSMIGPSPDWFVGVSGLSLLDAQGEWESLLEVDLFPYDAGTEDGTEFSLSNSATSPQGVITSIKGTGKFSNVRMARLTFTRQSVNPSPELILEASPATIVEAGGNAMVTVEITNGVTFAEDQEIALSFAGTATKGTDYTVALESLTLTAGQSSVATTVTAVQDRVDDDAETILITASHGDGTIGAEQTITIIDDDAAPAVTPCSGGMAGTYPCSNVDLMSFLALADIGGGSANDIWGWTDSSTGKEYAIMGRTSGTSFVDISDPVNPIYLGNLPPPAGESDERDIKVYADHAFIVTEANNSGMQVFDLTQLRMVASPPATFSETAHYPGFSDAHNLAINEDSGFAYAVGTNTCSGGLHMINIQTPTNPTLAGCFSGDGYTHDAQCVIYDGPDLDHQGKEICFNSNEDTLTIVDVTNKADPVMLSRTGYSDSRYAHQGWLTEDQGYFLLDDELDEANNPDVTNTRTYMWNVSDLDGPALIGFHDSTTTAIDHNQYVKGSYTYQSNYRAGLRILDITDIANGNLSEAAFFDVHPGSDSSNYDEGAWSNYPFFDSGIVIVSVIEQGLFILRPNLVESVNPALSSAAVNGTALTLTYGEALDEGSRPAPGDFTVQVDGSGRSVSGVSVSGRVVTLTLASAVAHGEAVRVSYSPGTNPIQDAVGNDALGLSNEPVTNTTGAPPPPPPPPPPPRPFPPPPPPQPSNSFPTADAGPDQTGVREDALVTLDGSGSSDPDDDPLRYRWNQLSGESVVLSSRNIVNPTFTAPQGLTADVVLSFRLLVTDPGGRFDSDTVTVTVTVTAAAEPPSLAVDSVVNAASLRPPTDPNGAVAPGSIVSLSGANLASQTLFASDLPLPAMLGETRITFDGTAAPLFLVSEGQIKAQVPFDLLPGEVSLQVHRGSQASEAQPLSVAAVSPGIFTVNQQGSGQGTVLIANTAILAASAGTVAGRQARPANRLEFIPIFCTGLGEVTNQPPSGEPAAEDGLSTTLQTARATIGGVEAPVSFSGLPRLRGTVSGGCADTGGGAQRRCG